MGRDPREVLDELAEGRGEAGFTFDDLVIEAGGEVGLGAIADWLARAHGAGHLVDLSGPDEDGPRRYVWGAKAPPVSRLDLRLPAEPRTVPTMRWAATKFAEKHAAADPSGIALAVSEAVTNAVLHAYDDGEDGEVRLVACAEPERLVVVVRDWGRRGMRPRPDSPGIGLGLPTVATIAREFNIEIPEGGGTLLRMHFPRG